MWARAYQWLPDKPREPRFSVLLIGAPDRSQLRQVAHGKCVRCPRAAELLHYDGTLNDCSVDAANLTRQQNPSQPRSAKVCHAYTVQSLVSNSLTALRLNDLASHCKGRRNTFLQRILLCGREQNCLVSHKPRSIPAIMFSVLVRRAGDAGGTAIQKVGGNIATCLSAGVAIVLRNSVKIAIIPLLTEDLLTEHAFGWCIRRL